MSRLYVVRAHMLQVRVTKPELVALRRAAKRNDLKVSVFVRARALAGLDVSTSDEVDTKQLKLFPAKRGKK